MSCASVNGMGDESSDLIATRLCGSCGLCCNGVLFHLVRLQTGDLISELAGLGLKIKRKKGRDQFSQPCPAYQNNHCTIYLQRPTRCRRFECRQLQGVIAGEIREEGAMTKIQEVQERVQRIERLMNSLGKTDLKRPLSKRYEKIMAECIDLSKEELISQRELEQQMTELQTILDSEFRLGPALEETTI